MVGCATAAIGAAIATGGTFLELVQVTIRVDAGHTLTISGTYFSTNRGKVVAGIALAVLVVALASGLRRADGVLFAFVGGLGGVAVLAFAVYDRIDVEDFVDQRAGARLGPALAVCLAGGLVMLIGALLTIYWPRAARRARRQTSP
jgi:NADH:ubiquinone oxidoreductase subunit F (NADH-binding)